MSGSGEQAQHMSGIICVCWLAENLFCGRYDDRVGSKDQKWIVFYLLRAEFPEDCFGLLPCQPCGKSDWVLSRAIFLGNQGRMNVESEPRLRQQFTAARRCRC